MKVAPVVRALEERAVCRVVLVHTGQHYDPELSDVFFRDLSLRQPDVFLAVGSASHAVQTARVMERFEPVVVEHRPAVVVVVGDVNSTIACALTASKITYAGGTRPLVAHVEAGLRSNDWSMPEEVNRVLTDRLSDLLLTPSPDADENLLREGISRDRIHCVGNVMIDSVLRMLPTAGKRWTELSNAECGMRNAEWKGGKPNAECGVPGHQLPSLQRVAELKNQGMTYPQITQITQIPSNAELTDQAKTVDWKKLGIKERGYALVTLHRPSNVDDPEVLRRIMSALGQISDSIPVLFPVHPRTRARLEKLGFASEACGMRNAECGMKDQKPEPQSLRGQQEPNRRTVSRRAAEDAEKNDNSESADCADYTDSRTAMSHEPSAMSPAADRERADDGPPLHLLPPLGYLDFLALERNAAIVLTDSGGVQEETTALGVSCLTLRENTERPITVTEGTNIVVGTDPVRIVVEARRILQGAGKKGRVPAGWDGKAGERIADVLLAAVARK
jgi:UDP-N-acetylglucosamine 2-epimerase